MITFTCKSLHTTSDVFGALAKSPNMQNALKQDDIVTNATPFALLVKINWKRPCSKSPQSKLRGGTQKPHYLGNRLFRKIVSSLERKMNSTESSLLREVFSV